MKTKNILSPVAILFALAVSSQVVAGNVNSFFLGNDAAMTAGSITALVRDSESIWYNPAGLGGNKLTRVNLSGNAFQLRLRTIDNGMVTTLPSGVNSQSLTGNEYLIVPTSLTFMTSITDRLSIGGGVYVPQYSSYTFNDNISSVEQFTGIPELTDFVQGGDVDVLRTQYQVGVSAGYEVKSNFRLGGGIFGLYDKLRYDSNLFEAIQSTDGSNNIDVFYEQNSRVFISSLGLRALLGMEYEFVPKWNLGLVVFSPTFQLCSWGEHSDTAGGSWPDASGTIVNNASRDASTFKSFDGKMIEPFHTQVALAYKQPDFWIGATADFFLPLRTPSLQISRKFMWNVSVGSKFRITEKINGGAGLFTDNSPERTIDDFGDSQINFYGLSLGAEFNTPVPRTVGENKTPIVFSTSLAFRYALGIGDVGGLTFDATTGQNISSAQVRRVGVTFNEIALYIGTGLFF